MKALSVVHAVLRVTTESGQPYSKVLLLEVALRKAFLNLLHHLKDSKMHLQVDGNIIFIQVYVGDT